MKNTISDSVSSYYNAALNELNSVESPEKFYRDKDLSIREWIKEWDFKKDKINIYTHQIHRYPAMFIPQLIRKLVEEYSSEGDLVLDIFNGSGTTTVESFLLNRKSIGIELNPLAHKLSKVKLTIINSDDLLKSYKKLLNNFTNNNSSKIIEFKSIDTWFNESSKIMLSKLLDSINCEENKLIRDILQISFSDIVRQVSVCKHSGFKLHRDLKKIDTKWDEIKILDLFHKSLMKSLTGLAQLNLSSNLKFKPQLLNADSKTFNKKFENEIDLIITSPPYGDSRTTVAYGQFSRLSSQWLGMISSNSKGHIENIDNKLLGGLTKGVDLEDPILLDSNTLKTSMISFQYLIDNAHGDQKTKLIKRAKDVLSFYIDLNKTIENGARYLKDDKYFILITGSRTVKGIKLNTDLIIAELGEKYGLLLDGILYRKTIPNKRMPHKVSATNIKGETTTTMNKESIILLRKKIITQT